jgi:hypothetical protein
VTCAACRVADARDVMRICLKYGINPNAPGKHPHTPNVSFSAHLASANAPTSNAAHLSSDLPSASSCRNGTLDYNTYYTTERLFTLPPLFFAAQRNNHYACLLLLNYGANVNVSDEQHCSPLHLAARLQHNVCEILISHHASITGANRYGDTPLSLWPIVKHLQTTFVEREFRKLCRHQSSTSKQGRPGSRDNEAFQAGTSPTVTAANHSHSMSTNGLKTFRRVFQHSRSDSNDSKSFKKSLSSQSSTTKSKRLASAGRQTSVQGISGIRSDSRQYSDERDDADLPTTSRSSYAKRKVSDDRQRPFARVRPSVCCVQVGHSSLAANIRNVHMSFCQRHQHSIGPSAHTQAESKTGEDASTRRLRCVACRTGPCPCRARSSSHVTHKSNTFFSFRFVSFRFASSRSLS